MLPYVLIAHWRLSCANERSALSKTIEQHVSKRVDLRAPKRAGSHASKRAGSRASKRASSRASKRASSHAHGKESFVTSDTFASHPSLVAMIKKKKKRRVT